MTPGAYIRKRREAAGMSVADVEAVLAGGGLLSAPLAEMEAGTSPPVGMDAALLSFAFEIDDIAVARLVDGEPVALCAACGCGGSVRCEHEHWGLCASPLAPGTLCGACDLEARSGAREAA